MAQGNPPDEEIKNCPACKKHLKKSKRYYRNGHYYCNKNCWTTLKQKDALSAS